MEKSKLDANSDGILSRIKTLITLFIQSLERYTYTYI